MISGLLPRQRANPRSCRELPPADTMPLRYLLGFLVTWVCLATAPGFDQPARNPSRGTPARVCLESVPTSASVPASSTASSLSRPPHWRHRIKTVLEEKDARAFQPVDLGPIVIPDVLGGSLRSAPRMDHSRPSIPLRC